jgi:hypothetical protein
MHTLTDRGPSDAGQTGKCSRPPPSSPVGERADIGERVIGTPAPAQATRPSCIHAPSSSTPTMEETPGSSMVTP